MGLVVNRSKGLDEGKGLGGSLLPQICIIVHSRPGPLQSASGLCSDAFLTDVRRAEAVSTTAAENSEENSTLGQEVMHATLPLRKPSSPGLLLREPTPCWRVKSEGAAVS